MDDNSGSATRADQSNTMDQTNNMGQANLVDQHGAVINQGNSIGQGDIDVKEPPLMDHNINQSNASIDQSDSMNQSGDVGVIMKTPNSYKYPLLKKYYEFGPWIGRNRKAICQGCRLQTSSSQPDRLLKHLNKCNALTDEDKIAVQGLMNERTANKRKKPMHLRRGDDGDSEYYGDDDPHTGDEMSGMNTSHHSLIPIGSLKKLRRDPGDKNSQIDDALTRFIMVNRIPLKTVHSPEFISFVRALNPDYHVPSRETITNVLIPGALHII